MKRRQAASALGAAGMALCLAAWLAAAEFVICPRCGYENEPHRDLCSHCLSPLPARAQPSTEVATPESAAPKGREAFPVGEEVVRAELEAARAALEEGDPELARLFYRNAAALDLLSDPQGGGERSGAIVRGIEVCEAAMPMGRKTCPACGGSGKRILTASTLSGETVRREAPGMACPRCGGAGYVTGARTLSEQIYARGQALRRFADRQRSRRYVAVGGAWLPADLAETLSVRQAARLKTATAAPCESCAGLGRTECAACAGTGWVKCPNRDCRNGMVEQVQGGQLGGTRIRRRVACPVCNGVGKAACDKCGGAGSVVCAACRGSGERPLCKSCAGAGFIACRRCGGTGRSKDSPCAACRGEGVAPCAACSGDGRQR